MTSTGAGTELGRISRLLTETPELETPLTRSEMTVEGMIRSPHQAIRSEKATQPISGA